MTTPDTAVPAPPQQVPARPVWPYLPAAVAAALLVHLLYAGVALVTVWTTAAARTDTRLDRQGRDILTRALGVSLQQPGLGHNGDSAGITAVTATGTGFAYGYHRGDDVTGVDPYTWARAATGVTATGFVTGASALPWTSGPATGRACLLDLDTGTVDTCTWTGLPNQPTTRLTVTRPDGWVLVRVHVDPRHTQPG